MSPMPRDEKRAQADRRNLSEWHNAPDLAPKLQMQRRACAEERGTAMGCLGFRQMNFEQILWIDSSGASGWEPKEAYDYYGSLACRTAGFVSGEDDDTITLVLSEADTGFNSSITIP